MLTYFLVCCSQTKIRSSIFQLLSFTVGTKYNRFICDNGATLVMCDRHISNYMSTLLPLLYIKIKGKYSEMQQTLVKALSYNTKQE